MVTKILLQRCKILLGHHYRCYYLLHTESTGEVHYPQFMLLARLWLCSLSKVKGCVRWPQVRPRRRYGPRPMPRTHRLLLLACERRWPPPPHSVWLPPEWSNSNNNTTHYTAKLGRTGRSLERGDSWLLRYRSIPLLLGFGREIVPVRRWRRSSEQRSAFFGVRKGAMMVDINHPGCWSSNLEGDSNFRIIIGMASNFSFYGENTKFVTKH